MRKALKILALLMPVGLAFAFTVASVALSWPDWCVVAGCVAASAATIWAVVMVSNGWLKKKK